MSQVIHRGKLQSAEMKTKGRTSSLKLTKSFHKKHISNFIELQRTQCINCNKVIHADSRHSQSADTLVYHSTHYMPIKIHVASDI